MGIIYKLTSPSKKSYIGQTIQDFNRRMLQHENSSKKDKNSGSRALYGAIRKYGFNNFTKEILLEINNDMLNHYEKIFIEAYNTLSSNGYNLTSGGDSNYKVSLETKLINSQIIKKKLNIEHLPLYMGTVRKEGEIIGYKIKGHPKDPKQVKFVNKDNLELVLKNAMNYLNILNSNQNELTQSHALGRRRNEENEIYPKYIYPVKENEILQGFAVAGHPNHLKQKKFRGKNKLDIAYEKAIKFLEKLNINNT